METPNFGNHGNPQNQNQNQIKPQQSPTSATHKIKIKPNPPLPLSTGHSKKKKKKEIRTPNLPIHHDPQPQSHHNLPRSTLIQNPINVTELERATTHAGLDAPTNHDGAMIHGKDEKLGIGSDGKRKMG